MVSDTEIEAACKAFLAEYGDPSAEWWDYRKEVTAALTAAARVREEANNECGEAAHPAPQPSVKVKPLEWVASDDWEYRWTADLYAIEDQGKNWSTDRYWLYYNGQRLGKFGTLDTALFTAQADYDRRILSALTAGKPEQHPDDEAVDCFAAAMKAKLKWEREERGRYGWNDPEVCSEKYLARLLIEHLAKGNDGNFEDVANFCMMLHQRGAHPRVLADVLTAGKLEQSAWRPIETAPKDGTWIIAHRPNKGVGYLDRVVVVRWENEVSAWVWPDKPFDIYDEDLSERVYADSWADQISLFEDNSFTHWLPLPTPPTAGGDDE